MSFIFPEVAILLCITELTVETHFASWLEYLSAVDLLFFIFSLVLCFYDLSQSYVLCNNFFPIMVGVVGFLLLGFTSETGNMMTLKTKILILMKH